MPGVFQFSQTANSNSSAVPTIDWSEGQAPSSVNNSARAEMAAVACYRDDISGMLVTGGTSAAYSITSNQGFDTLANFHNKAIYFTPHVTNAAGPVTVSIDGFANLPLRSSPGVELPAGTIIRGTPYGAIYNNTDGSLYLQGFFGNPYLVPIGGMIDYIGPTAPNSSFIFPLGQAISRVTYASLFSGNPWSIGTTYGPGDGSTTFNVIDMTGRVGAMKEAVATRLTSTYFGGDSTVLGAVGGAEKETLLTTNLPPYTPSGTIANVNNSFNEAGSGISVITPSGSLSVPTLTNSMSVTSTFTGTPQGGTSKPVPTVQPTIIVNKLLRIA